YWERGTRQFVFHDDNFLVPSEARNHERISKLEKALKRGRVENIALLIKCRPADANGRVLRRLKELGLVRVFLGVEAATARGRRGCWIRWRTWRAVQRWMCFIRDAGATAA